MNKTDREILLCLRELEAQQLTSKAKEELTKAIKLLLSKEDKYPVINVTKESVARAGYIPPTSPVRVELFQESTRNFIEERFIIQVAVEAGAKHSELEKFSDVLLYIIREIGKATGLENRVTLLSELSLNIHHAELLNKSYVKALETALELMPELREQINKILTYGIKL